MDYEEASELMSSQGWRRLVIDEPQDGATGYWSTVMLSWVSYTYCKGK